MCPRGQNYTNLCWKPAVNLNDKVAPKHKFENRPRHLLAIGCRKTADKIGEYVDIATFIELWTYTSVVVDCPG